MTTSLPTTDNQRVVQNLTKYVGTVDVSF